MATVKLRAFPAVEEAAPAPGPPPASPLTPSEVASRYAELEARQRRLMEMFGLMVSVFEVHEYLARVMTPVYELVVKAITGELVEETKRAEREQARARA
jgi:hypothetical protein